MIKTANPNATKEVKSVLEYFENIRGKGMITGLHTQTREQEELKFIEKETGKLPALCGFELLAYSPNINWESCNEACLKELRENEGTLQQAYEWAEKGGLLTFTWHWYSPIGGVDKAFYAENTDFDATKVLEEGTPERTAFYHDMDVMAELLQGFADKHIPILWRPFHEAEGNWFWWGVKGLETAGQLYREMFDYYTKEKHLDNLIWVWNCPRPDGYVGDAYCDIVSADYYPPAHHHTSMKKELDNLKTITVNKPYAIGEIGTVPDINAVEAEGADWLWFMMWSKDFVLTDTYNSAEEYCRQFNAEYAITLEKLPKLY